MKSESRLLRADDASCATLLTEFFERTAGRINRLTERANLPMNSLATTLSVAVITRRHWACARVGDSPALIAYDSTRLRTVARTAQSEYVNETTFLNGHSWRDEIVVEGGSIEDIHGMALISDGLAFCSINLASLHVRIQ
jgi:hypothetical protein